MKLYEIPRRSIIYGTLPNGKDEPIFFEHIDGAYSLCKTMEGELCHLWANTELEPYKAGYKMLLGKV